MPVCLSVRLSGGLSVCPLKDKKIANENYIRTSLKMYLVERSTC